MAVPAFILRKVKLLNESSLKPLSIVLLYILQPFLVINAFANFGVEPTAAIARNLAIMFGLGIAAHVIPFFILKLTVYFTKKTDDEAKRLRKGAFLMSAVFGNAGFVGVNFILMLFNDGSHAPLYAAAFVSAFNIMLWTLGVFSTTNDFKKVEWKKTLLAPAIVAVFIAVPLFFIPQINFLRTVSYDAYGNAIGEITRWGQGVRFLADASLPISMFIVGIRLGSVPIKSLFTDVGVLICSTIRLILVPLLMLALTLPFLLTGALYSIDPDNYIIVTLFIFASMPVAASAVAFAERFDGDKDTAVKAFLFSTLVSLLTVPLMLTLLIAIVS